MAHEEIKNGLPDGWQARLRRRSPDFFFPTRGLEAAGLKEGIGDHGHKACRCSPNQDRPSKWSRPKFLLHLLMRLFAYRSGFDRGGKGPEADVGGKIGHVVFLLARRPALADEPDFVAGHALHAIIGHAVLVAVSDADATGRKEAGQTAFVPRRQLILRHVSPAKAVSAEIRG